MPSLQWGTCPVCGRGFSGLSPGAPCSSGCAAQLRIQQRSNIPDSSNPSAGKSAPRHGSGGPTGASGGGCFSSAVLLLATGGGAVGALGYGAARITGLI